jgi:Penicillin binding protein transpeptidase domain
MMASRKAPLLLAIALCASLGTEAWRVAAWSTPRTQTEDAALMALRASRAHFTLTDRDGVMIMRAHQGTLQYVGGLVAGFVVADLLERSVAASLDGTEDSAVRTTIDWRLETSLSHLLGGRGSAAVVDVYTGELLALVSPETSALVGPPGSVFKIITFAAALDSKTIADDTAFPVITSYHGVTNAFGRACGGGVEQVIALSCNTAAAAVGDRLAPVDLERAAQRWGFGRAALPGMEPSTIGSVARIENLPYGREFTAEGLLDVRLDVVTGALAAAAVEDGGLEPVLHTAPGSHPSSFRVMEPETAGTLLAAMRLAVTDGSARRATVAGCSTIAKTGTPNVGAATSGWTIAACGGLAVALYLPGSAWRSYDGPTDAAPLASQALALGRESVHG